MAKRQQNPGGQQLMEKGCCHWTTDTFYYNPPLAAGVSKLISFNAIIFSILDVALSEESYHSYHPETVSRRLCNVFPSCDGPPRWSHPLMVSWRVLRKMPSLGFVHRDMERPGGVALSLSWGPLFAILQSLFLSVVNRQAGNPAPVRCLGIALSFVFPPTTIGVSPRTDTESVLHLLRTTVRMILMAQSACRL